MALEWGDAPPDKLLHNHWRRLPDLLQPGQAGLDMSKPMVGKLPVLLAGAGSRRHSREYEQGAGHAGVHEDPLLPESLHIWAEREVNTRASHRCHGLECHAPRALAGVDQAEREEVAK